MKKIYMMLFFLFCFSSAQGASTLQQMQQLVDYVGVDYPGAVIQGKVQNQVEYDEMLDFAGTISELAKNLPMSDVRETVQKEVFLLKDLVVKKASAKQVSRTTGSIRQLLIDGYDLSVVPGKLPDLQRGKALYASQCTACHGVTGKGDGALAAELEPTPTNFTDLERYRQRTLYGLYSTITHGVEGTAMKSYANLTNEDRWALAFHVGRLAPAPDMLSAGEQAFLASNGNAVMLDKQALTTLTPVEVIEKYGDQTGNIVAWLRSRPDVLYQHQGKSTLSFARQKLRESLAAYVRGERRKAHDLAVTAYLEGFELVEGNLDNVDHALRLQIEDAMTGYRGLIKDEAEPGQLYAWVNNLDVLLLAAEKKLTTTQLSASTAFASALMILLREGLEAILVIAALAAFLIKTGRRDGLRYLYTGTVAAFLLGVATWYVSSNIVQIGGAGRELTEGFAALFAATMLFYVGFWLHSKTGAAQWKAFIQGSIKKALSKGTLWGLSGLAFIAVYREIFETVLFYQALWLQTGDSGRGMILSGFLVASVMLVLLGWLILRYSTRLPLRQFFSVTSVFMFVLAIVFAGKGIAALQEAGKLPVSLIDFPRIDLLGIYPNLEGLGVQLALVLAALLLLWNSNRNNNRLSDQ